MMVVVGKARRVRELAGSCRSKFKLARHPFSIVQFPKHQFVWKVRSVEFGTPGPSTSVQCSSVQFIIPLSSPTLRALTRIDLADLQGLLVQISNWFSISLVQFGS